MKKTTEQIKNEVINYLTKTSMHTFLKPKMTFDWSTSTYQYDYNDSTKFNVIKEGNDFKVVDGEKSYIIDIDQKIKYYGDDAKCVIKHSLFLDKKMKSIKSRSKILK